MKLKSKSAPPSPAVAGADTEVFLKARGRSCADRSCHQLAICATTWYLCRTPAVAYQYSRKLLTSSLSFKLSLRPSLLSTFMASYWCFLALATTLCLQCLSSVVQASECDMVIESNGSHKNGTIASPGWPSHYSSNLHCTYRLIAAANERVQLKFVNFEVRALPPKCSYDYVEIITMMKEPDDDLLDLPLHGRYCGSNMEDIPNLLISMYNYLILSFKSDDSKEDRGFLAEYKFIDDSDYVVGTPSTHPICGQTIYGEKLPRGTIRSPTYPGMYPDNILCHYSLQGVRGQRIKLTFIDLDLFSGGDHCPFDRVRVYDGRTKDEEVTEIGTYCGNNHNFTIFSTKESLYIEFETLEGRADRQHSYYDTDEDVDERGIQQRGFLAEFSFSNDFVNLNFITSLNGHIRGTECDQRICSDGGSSGIIISPNFNDTYPLNTVCHYYIDGIIDKQDLEKVIVTFTAFDIPTVKEKCDNGFLAAYRRGQNIVSFPVPDLRFCGLALPPTIESSSPRLTIVFNSTGVASGTGFRARYTFETNYDIPGTPATTTSECHFLYYSASARRGHVKSPRHPTYYPNATDCRYQLFPKPNQAIRLIFESFQIDRGSFNNCSNDYLNITSVMSNGRRQFMGMFCGMYLPGPVISENDITEMDLHFHSDSDGVVDTGFRVSYEFIGKPPDADCSKNFTTASGGGGEIKSPHHPLKYPTNKICEWGLNTVVPKARIILSFHRFEIEANQKIQPNGDYRIEGCPQAILEIYTSMNGPPKYRLCGDTPPSEQIISDGNSMRLRFISTDDAKGLEGFDITWTEVLLPLKAEECQGFSCAVSGYCISSTHWCNGRSNCGINDESDEDDYECSNSGSNNDVLHIILGIVISIVFLAFLIVILLHRRRKRRKSKRRQEIEVRYVTRNTNCNRANAGPAGEKMLKEQTEKVSIV